MPQALLHSIDRTVMKSQETRLGMGRSHKANLRDGWLAIYKDEEPPTPFLVCEPEPVEGTISSHGCPLN